MKRLGPGEFEFGAPGTPGGAFGNPSAPGEVAVGAEVFMPDDYDIVSNRIEVFMADLYGTDRYANHNDRLLEYYDTYFGGQDEPEGDQDPTSIDRMTIILHDFVEHAILNPEGTADRLGPAGKDAETIRTEALATFTDLLNDVGDQDGLVKAYLFTIDMSKWEAEARLWRGGATNRVAEMIWDGTIAAEDAKVINAAVNKTPDLEHIEHEELERVLRKPEHCLVDLELGAISEGTLKHNLKGLFFKGLETLDIIKHPPAGNPASTYRDCTEAINFFVPALMALGHKQMAIDLRDAALQWFFDDSEGHAKSQHELSQQHLGAVEAKAIGMLEAEFGGIEVAVESRVKSEGSLREKLAKEAYQGIHKAPDGIGLAFIVPDDMAGPEMSLFAEQYMTKISFDPQVVAGHPNPVEGAFDDMQGDKRRGSGYEAVHMTFFYTTPDGADVPFEIQVLTQEQHRKKMYGPSSDLFYKAGTEYSSDDQPHLKHLEARARAERELAPSTTIQSLAEMGIRSSEIPSIYNKLFQTIDIDGIRIMASPELAMAVEALPPDVLDAEGSLTVLPPNFVVKTQLLEALSMFDSGLATDRNILNAVDLIQATEAGNVRNDGKTPIVEGHLLPTALAAVMLAVQSGKIWKEGLDPAEHISNIATIALLHDHIENVLEGMKDNPDLQTATRQLMLYEIKQKFGQTVMEGVDAMTLPFEIKDEFERREQYAKNIQENEYAKFIKPADRWQNHLSDLMRLANGEVSADSDDGRKIMEYFAKTDRHLSETFTSDELPPPYRRVHNVVWQLARQAGYKS